MADVKMSSPTSSPSKLKTAENKSLKNSIKHNYHGLSQRAIQVLENPSVTTEYVAKVDADKYDPETNPDGYVDFGMADNFLVEDLLTAKLEQQPSDIPDTSLMHYPDFQGLSAFRETTATFVQREFKSVHEIKADQIAVACGVTSFLDTMAFALGMPGEYFMTTSPDYYRIKNDIGDRPALKMLWVPLNPETTEDGTPPYTLNINDIEETYLKATEEGKVVRAFVLVNPDNPLGSVYTAQNVKDILDFCAKYKLHAVVDEIYALSVFDENTTFTSVLALNHPDPERTHFLWGFSKDFALSGYRCSVVWSQNKDLISYVTAMGILQQSAPVMQMRLKFLMDDEEWFTKTYHPALMKRMRAAYKVTKDAIEGCGAWINNTLGGMFIWLDASKFMPEDTYDGEMWLLNQFMEEKIFLIPGQECHSTTPGYFRLVFTLPPKTLEEGLRRLVIVLNKTKQKTDSASALTQKAK